MYAFHLPRHMTKWRLGGTRRYRAYSGICLSHPLIRQAHNPLLPNVLRSSGGVPLRSTPFRNFGRSRRAYTTESFKNFANKNPILLRDTCQCSQCIDLSTRQRDFNYAEIPSNIEVSSIEPDLETETWKVSWINDIPGYTNHTSVFTQSSLVQLLDGIPAGLDVQRSLSIWDSKTFASETKDIDYSSLLKDDDTLATALSLLQTHGLVFVTNIPDHEEAVRHLTVRLTGLYRNTFYGESWDVRSVPQAKNVAYTSKYLGFHMDLLYMKESPGLQLLHCLQNSCTGGESEFADTFRAVDLLRKEEPRYVETLVRSKIRYGYQNDGHFYSDDKPVIKLSQGKHLPSVDVRGASDPDFMQDVECVYWSPPFINSIAGAADGDTLEEFIEASKAFAEVLQRPELIYETKLPAGTCAVFDNLRVVHARKAFDMNSGKRWLKGIYGDRQDLLSKSLKHGVLGKSVSQSA